MKKNNKPNTVEEYPVNDLHDDDEDDRQAAQDLVEHHLLDRLGQQQHQPPPEQEELRADARARGDAPQHARRDRRVEGRDSARRRAAPVRRGLLLLLLLERVLSGPPVLLGGHDRAAPQHAARDEQGRILLREVRRGVLVQRRLEREARQVRRVDEPLDLVADQLRERDPQEPDRDRLCPPPPPARGARRDDSSARTDARVSRAKRRGSTALGGRNARGGRLLRSEEEGCSHLVDHEREDERGHGGDEPKARHLLPLAQTEHEEHDHREEREHDDDRDRERLLPRLDRRRRLRCVLDAAAVLDVNLALRVRELASLVIDKTISISTIFER